MALDSILTAPPIRRNGDVEIEITLDQLTARDNLFNDTQAAQRKRTRLASRLLQGRPSTPIHDPHCNRRVATNLPVGWARLDDEGSVCVTPAVRIGNCSGFYGDRLSAMREMLTGGELDYLTGDYLAELTMLILGRDRMKYPDRGYAKTFLRQLEDCLGLALDRGVRIVANAGGLNPAGLAAGGARAGRPSRAEVTWPMSRATTCCRAPKSWGSGTPADRQRLPRRLGHRRLPELRRRRRRHRPGHRRLGDRRPRRRALRLAAAPTTTSSPAPSPPATSSSAARRPPAATTRSSLGTFPI